MQALIQGRFMEQKSRTDKKTGEVIPVAHIYSGSEVVQIVGCDCSHCSFGEEVQIPARISVGSYGLYVRVSNDE